MPRTLQPLETALAWMYLDCNVNASPTCHLGDVESSQASQFLSVKPLLVAAEKGEETRIVVRPRSA